MNKKEKGMLVIMVLLFVLSAGIYGYDKLNPTQVVTVNDEVEVLLALTDIGQNEPIDESATAWVKIDRKYLTDKFITRETVIDGKVVTTAIFKDEYITTDRIGEETVSKNSMYEVSVQPAFASTIKNGDLVRAYVQIVNKEKNQIVSYLLFDKKVVSGIPVIDPTLPEQNKSKFVDFISLKLTAEESLRYYGASQVGNVIVIKYDSLVSEKEVIATFDIDAWSKKEEAANAE